MRTVANLHDRTDPAELRRVYGCFPSGVAAICALNEKGAPTGMAVSSFTPVSLDPPLVSVCMQNASATWPALRRARRLGVSVLAEAQDAVALSLASRTGDRFAGLNWAVTGEGAVLLDEASAWLECALDTEHMAGDHTVALLRVLSLAGDPARQPLVFHGSRFRGLTG